MSREFKPGTVLKHFKRDSVSRPGAAYTYVFLGIAHSTETGEELAIYRALYGDKQLYARPYNMFMSPVDKEKYPDVQQDFRFEPLVEKEYFTETAAKLSLRCANLRIGAGYDCSYIRKILGKCPFPGRRDCSDATPARWEKVLEQISMLKYVRILDHFMRK